MTMKKVIIACLAGVVLVGVVLVFCFIVLRCSLSCVRACCFYLIVFLLPDCEREKLNIGALSCNNIFFFCGVK